MYKALIFDYDDTIVDTFTVRARCIQECGRTYYGLDVGIERIRELWGLPFAKFIEEVYQTDEPYELVSAKYFKIAQNYPAKLIQGVKQLLEELRSQYPIGIVTASNKVLIDLDFQQLGISRELFFKIQDSDETDFHKPDPRVFTPMIARLKEKRIEPSEVVFIGDSRDDFKAATGAGFNFIGVLSGLTSAQQFQELGVETIASLGELPRHL